MITQEALKAAREAYDIEEACIHEMTAYFDGEQFSKAVELLSAAPRIGAAGCGHSGIICQHFAHLMCCIERPARFISPAEAVHGATGFLQKGDVMVFASRGGKTKELLPIVDICKAKGVSIIEDAQYIERGYEDIIGKLTALGASIRRSEAFDSIPAVAGVG